MRPDRFGQSEGRDFVESPGRDREHPYLGNGVHGITLNFRFDSFPPFTEKLLQRIGAPPSPSIVPAKPFSGYKKLRITESYSDPVGTQPWSVVRETSYEQIAYGGFTITQIRNVGTPTDFSRAIGSLNSGFVTFPETFRSQTALNFAAITFGNRQLGNCNMQLEGGRFDFASLYQPPWIAFKSLGDFTQTVSRWRYGPAGLAFVSSGGGITFPGPSSLAINPLPGDASVDGLQLVQQFKPSHFAMEVDMGFIKRLIPLSDTIKVWDVESDVYSSSQFHELACDGNHDGVEVIEPIEISEDDLPENQYQWLIRHRFSFPPDNSVGGYVGTLRPSCAPEITS